MLIENCRPCGNCSHCLRFWEAFPTHLLLLGKAQVQYSQLPNGSDHFVLGCKQKFQILVEGSNQVLSHVPIQSISVTLPGDLEQYEIDLEAPVTSELIGVLQIRKKREVTRWWWHLIRVLHILFANFTECTMWAVLSCMEPPKLFRRVDNICSHSCTKQKNKTMRITETSTSSVQGLRFSQPFC